MAHLVNVKVRIVERMSKHILNTFCVCGNVAVIYQSALRVQKEGYNDGWCFHLYGLLAEL